MNGLAHHRAARPPLDAIGRFKPISVAACVVRDPEGSVLMARRRPDQMSPGFWEVPGGKVEPGETESDAAIRELREETGLDASGLTKLTQYSHQFPSRRINLTVFEAHSWSGQPYGRENQALDWVRPDRPQVGPILESNLKLLRLLSLPRTVICVDPPRTDVFAWADDVAIRALTCAAGAAFFNCGHLPPAQQIALGRRLLETLKRHGIALWIDGTPDTATRVGAELAARGGAGPQGSEVVHAAMATVARGMSDVEVLLDLSDADFPKRPGSVYVRRDSADDGPVLCLQSDL